jgi:hypothetical protein
MRVPWQGHRRLSHFVMSTSPPDFTEYPDGASSLLPALHRVDSWMAKVEFNIGMMIFSLIIVMRLLNANLWSVPLEYSSTKEKRRLARSF